MELEEKQQNYGVYSIWPKHGPVVIRLNAMVLQQDSFFAALLEQQQALTEDLYNVRTIASFLREYTARKQGLTLGKALNIASYENSVAGFIRGANAKGKCAEVIATTAYERLHFPHLPQTMVNPPPNPSRFIVGYRVNPDTASCRDLIVEFLMDDGKRWFAPGGQVKVGAPGYVYQRLLRMALDPRYGKLGIVDAVLVNPDGTPRVAVDGFTQGQADALRKAGIHLRGIPGLHRDAKRLYRDSVAAVEAVEKGKADFWPSDRAVKRQLDTHFSWKGIGARAGVAVAAAAILASAVEVAGQIHQGRKKEEDHGSKKKEEPRASWWSHINWGRVLRTGAFAGATAAATVTVEAGIYHTSVWLDLGAVAAKGVSAYAGAFIATGYDAWHEVSAAKVGEVSWLDATGHFLLKAVSNVGSAALPLYLGPWGIPLAIGLQIGSRFFSSWLRKETSERTSKSPSASGFVSGFAVN